MEEKLIDLDVETYARNHLLNLLDNDSFVDGYQVKKASLASETRVMIWEDILQTNEAQKKPFYLVYKFNAIDRSYGDDDVKTLELTIQISLFTTQDFSSKKVKEVRGTLEKLFANNELFDRLNLLTKYYDLTTKLNQLVYETKVFYAV